MNSIAIDGPSGAGKSTLAKQLAEKLGFLYVDTGAIYRTVALYVKQNGIDPADQKKVEMLLSTIDISMAYGEDGIQRMYLDKRDVSEDIRLHAISQMTSLVAKIPAVRAFLLDFQRGQAREHNVVMDGRDIGTVVLPQANVKIFLTASPEARADRRYKELCSRGQDISFDTILHDIVQRDAQDVNREIAPLKQAEDAVVVDTTHLNLAESLSVLLQSATEGLKP